MVTAPYSVIKRSWVQLTAVPLSCNNSDQVVHIHVPLSTSSIIWYLLLEGGDICAWNDDRKSGEKQYQTLAG